MLSYTFSTEEPFTFRAQGNCFTMLVVVAFLMQKIIHALNPGGLNLLLKNWSVLIFVPFGILQLK